MIKYFLLFVGLYIFLGAFEMWFPAEPGQTPMGRARNMAFTVIFFAGGLSALALIHTLFNLKGSYLPDHGVLFSMLIVLVDIFLIDFIFYWYHRAEHTFPILWLIHELHHSDTELNATTSIRTYWLEYPIQVLFVHFPVIYLVGLDLRALVILPIVKAVWLFFTHANWRLHFGFLTPIICGPQLHRIHHSNVPHHQAKNFAQFFPIFDILFGTYYAPTRDEFPQTGTPGLATDASISEVLLKPFKGWLLFLKKALVVY
jgi:sterol desaturase/sphingolipid hydroxylase (fatty acid hydroxylase superfamily)